MTNAERDQAYIREIRVICVRRKVTCESVSAICE